MTVILDGKKLSAKIIEDLTEKVAQLEKKPHLAVLLIGNDPASELYVSLKQKATEKIGMSSSIITYPASVLEEDVLQKISELNSDAEVDAILVQFPLPSHIDEKKVIQAIAPQKDADGIAPENVGKIAIGLKPYAYPCTPKGIMALIDEYELDLEGKHAVVVGRSNIVGKPLAQLLLNRNATVTVCHSKTQNLSEITKTADILVSAVGKYGLIKSDMIKQNAVVIDVGTTRIDGKPKGDVDFDGIIDKASFVAPVPGGVGPMTIAMLMDNTFNLARLSHLKI